MLEVTCEIPGVRISNGYRLEVDPDYGETVSMTDATGLFAEIFRTALGDRNGFGPDRLRFVRKHLELTQKEFGLLLGWPEAYVIGLESGNLPFDREDVDRIIYSCATMDGGSVPQMIATRHPWTFSISGGKWTLLDS